MKISNRGLQLGGLALALGAGILIGKGGDSEAGGRAAAGGTEQMPPNDSERSRRRSERGAGGSSRLDAGDVSAVERELEAILATTSQLQRTQMLLSLLDRLPDEEFAKVYDRIKKASVGTIYDAERLTVLQAWAERDPLAAGTHLLANGGDAREQETVVYAWAAVDPEGAFAWATSAAGNGILNVNAFVVGTLRRVATSNPKLARSMLERLEEGKTRDQALFRVEDSVTQFGYNYAEDWVTGIGDETLRLEASWRLADSLTRLDPERAAAFALSIDDPDTWLLASKNVAQAWASQDLQGATTWVESLPEGSRTRAVESVALRYGLQDPVAGAEWLISMGDSPDLDRAQNTFIRFAFEQDPAVSLSFVPNLADESDQVRSYDRYLGRWLETDPQAARNWTESNAGALPEEILERFLR